MIAIGRSVSVAARWRQTAMALFRPATDPASDAGRAHERHRRVALTAAASAAARAMTIVATLVTVPLALRYLGAERYGVWLVISSFSMMLAFADLGLGNGIVNEIAAAHGRDDRAAIRRIVSSGYLVLGGIALGLLLVLAVAYPLVPWDRLFNVSTALARAESRPAVAVWLVCFALAIPLTLVQKVQAALQQGFVAALWQCAGSVAQLAVLVVVVKLGGGLPALVAALVGTPLAVSAANTLWFFRSPARDIAPAPALASRVAIRGAAVLGLQFFVLQFLASIAYGLDPTIIAQLAGAAAVASYAVPERMFSVVTMLLGMVMQPLWPAYGEAIARGDHAWVRRTLVRSLLLAGGASLAAVALLVLAGPALLRLWVGSSVSAPLLLLLGLATWKVVEALGTTIAVYLNGTGALGFQIMVALASGIAMLAAKIVLVRTIGVAGIPWAASAAFVSLALIPSLFYIRTRLA